MSSNCIPVTLRDLLTKLEFLSMIERGKKPCMGDMVFVDSSSWYGSFYRSFYGESKKSMLLHINQIIDQAIGAIDEYANTEFIEIIVATLSKAKIGIINLITTYQDHPHVISQVNVIISNINLQLERNRRYLQMKTGERKPLVKVSHELEKKG